MKKIIVLTSGLTHGGVNRTLLNSLGVLGNEYEFDIFSIYSDGPYIKLFRDYNVITVFDISNNIKPLRVFSKKSGSAGKIIRKTVDCFTKFNIHVFKKKISVYIGKKLSLNNYDTVISFQEGYMTELATYIRADKHIAWIHCDYSRYIKQVGRDESDIYCRYDSIVCVSDYTAGMFRKLVPIVADRVVSIHNIMDSKEIISRSLEHIDKDYPPDHFIMVSIGRMDPVKRFSHIPVIAEYLKDNGMRFIWYIIGDGGSEAKIVRESISDHKLENEVIMLGEIDNPFPYVRSASALVCLSSSEACPNVIREALILHTPVVTTDFPSSSEFITDGSNGLICTIDDMPDVILKLFENRNIYNNINSNLSEYIMDNTEIIEKIEALF